VQISIQILPVSDTARDTHKANEVQREYTCKSQSPKPVTFKERKHHCDHSQFIRSILQKQCQKYSSCSLNEVTETHFALLITGRTDCHSWSVICGIPDKAIPQSW